MLPRPITCEKSRICFTYEKQSKTFERKLILERKMDRNDFINKPPCIFESDIKEKAAFILFAAVDSFSKVFKLPLNGALKE